MTEKAALYDVIRKPVITEKATLASEYNALVFEVAMDANKVEIRQAVAAMFKVDVESVRTLVVRGKNKRIGRWVGKRANWKKAIVTLKEGHEIDFFGEI